MNGLISVVVPVYRIGPYLDRCVESLAGQTYRDLEILLVDDGSPDDCPQKCDAWQRRDPRVRVIHQQNAGLGMARNAGLDQARGEYVCFIDGDDYIAPETVTKAYEAAVKNDAEIVIFGMVLEDEAGSVYQRVVPKPPKPLFIGDEVRSYVLPNLICCPSREKYQWDMWASSCICLYSTAFIRRVGWHFVSEREIISEDVYSLLRLYSDVRRVAIVPEAFYHYCERDSSLTHVFRPDRSVKVRKCYQACCDLCDELGYQQEIKDRLALLYLSNVIGALKSIAAADENRRKTVDAILQDECLQGALACVDLRKEKAARQILFITMRWKNAGLLLFLLDMKQRLRHS